MEKTFKNILKEIKLENFQEKNKKIKFPNNIKDLPNLIIYGPPNSGKYYYSLSIVSKYSMFNDNLPQKKLEIEMNKNCEVFHSSDIHYEIDFDLLGTSAKNIWYSFYNHICDILYSKQNKICIILVKNFHQIHEDLLNVFYSFMQNNNPHIRIKFILITQQITFIPENIKTRCVTLKCKSITKQKLINNDRYKNNYIFYNNHIDDSKELITFIINFKENYIYKKKNSENQYSLLREILYNILIKNYNINNVFNQIIFTLIEMDLIENNEKLIQNMYDFIKYYNNNYRPIYHLEKITFDIIDNLKN